MTGIRFLTNLRGETEHNADTVIGLYAADARGKPTTLIGAFKRTNLFGPRIITPAEGDVPFTVPASTPLALCSVFRGRGKFTFRANADGGRFTRATNCAVDTWPADFSALPCSTSSFPNQSLYLQFDLVLASEDLVLPPPED